VRCSSNNFVEGMKTSERRPAIRGIIAAMKRDTGASGDGITNICGTITRGRQQGFASLGQRRHRQAQPALWAARAPGSFFFFPSISLFLMGVEDVLRVRSDEAAQVLRREVYIELDAVSSLHKYEDSRRSSRRTIRAVR